MAGFYQTLVLVFGVASVSMAALIHPRSPSKEVTLDATGGEGQKEEGVGGIPEAATGPYEEENGVYFEGDLNIRQELIEAYYGKYPVSVYADRFIWY